jgi:hypothetical protein
MAESLSIPEIGADALLSRGSPQNDLKLLKLLNIQLARPTGTFSFHQARQTITVKALHPILHCPNTVAQQLCDLRSAHALSDQKDSVQSMVVFFR